MNNLNLKYNEKEYAEKLLNNGFISENYYKYELKILAKYYKEQGFSYKEIENLLYDFCNKHLMNFNKVMYFKTIDSVINFVKKKTSKLIIVDEIPITDNEFEYINNIDLRYNYKKILFTLLIYNKINKKIADILYNNPSKYNFFGGKKKQYKEVMLASKAPKKYSINKAINHFNNIGLVDVRTRGKINLLFVEKINESNNIFINIKTFDNIGNYFDWLTGNNKSLIKCQMCSAIIIKTSNRKQYCDKCWEEKERELKREWKRRYDKNK